MNQRGFTGGAVKPYQYFADRWLNYPDNGEDLDVSISGNGITVSPNGGANLFQHIPDINKFYGKMMTIAVGLSDGTVICNSAIVPSEPWRGFAEVGTEKVRILGHTFDGSRGAVFITPRANVTIAWAALYEGEYTAETLPEYQPKGYGAELAECQRYSVLIPHTVEGFVIGYGVASTENYAYFTVDLPVTLHEHTNIKPTIEGTFQIRGEGNIHDDVSVNCFSANGHKLIIECFIPSNVLSPMKFYVLRALGNILISKEL